MASLYVIGHLKTAGGDARRKVVDALTKVSKYSAAQEPGVTKFCVALPRQSEGDETSVFAIEEYADLAAMDKHMASPAVAELLKAFSSDPSLFSSEPAIYGLPTHLFPSTTFTRPSIAKISDPFLIFVNFEYKPGFVGHSIVGWKGLVESAEEAEPGTLSYTVLADVEKCWVRTVEAYESEDFMYGTHVKSAAFAENQMQNGALRTGKKEIHRLKVVAGYLWKEEEKPRL